MPVPRISPLVILLPLSLAAAAAPDSWPQFRGPDGQGHAASAAGLPASWSENENIVWKCPLPGRGWSSPVMDGHEIWLTAAVEAPITEAEKAQRLKETTNTQPL